MEDFKKMSDIRLSRLNEFLGNLVSEPFLQPSEKAKLDAIRCEIQRRILLSCVAKQDERLNQGSSKRL